MFFYGETYDVTTAFGDIKVSFTVIIKFLEDIQFEENLSIFVLTITSDWQKSNKKVRCCVCNA
jgi:hypothetical protein